MTHRNIDPSFDREEIEDNDPLGEEAFEADGFVDAPDGGPAFNAEGMDDDGTDKQAGGAGQKMAGIPEAAQRQPNTPSEQRPDTTHAIIKERGGVSKGDPAVGGTRSD